MLPYASHKIHNGIHTHKVLKKNKYTHVYIQ